MKTANFTKEELQNYWDKKDIMFFNYRRLFQLNFSVNCGFYFMEVVSARLINNSLPYTKRGRFHALNNNEAQQLMEF